MIGDRHLLAPQPVQDNRHPRRGINTTRAETSFPWSCLMTTHKHLRCAIDQNFEARRVDPIADRLTGLWRGLGSRLEQHIGRQWRRARHRERAPVLPQIR
eukprot:7227682-Lingulodinium_polyedra.AAC.1